MFHVVFMLVFHKDKSNIHKLVIMNFKSFYIFATCVINIASLAYNRIIVLKNTLSLKFMIFIFRSCCVLPGRI